MNKTEYVEKILNKCEEGTTLESEYVNAHTKITLRCSKGHIRQATSNSIISRGSSVVCKECKGYTSTGKIQQWKIAEEFTLNGYTLEGEYEGALTKVLAKNNICGHSYLVVPNSITRGRVCLCPVCTTSRRSGYTSESFAKELKGMGLVPEEPYVNMKTNLDITNEVCGHSYTINPGHLLYDKIGIKCPVCHGLGSGTIKNRFLSLLNDNNLSLSSPYIKTQENVLVTNNNCGHSYTVLPNNMVNNSTGITCRTCTPETKISRAEIDIYEFIRSKYSGWVEQSDRTILNGRELDIVLPDLGIAIEYNGAKWHSADYKPINYHLNKTREVEEFGYRLIHIMEQEWLESPDIVKSRICAILGVSPRKLFARNTLVKELDFFPAEFLKENHIQGAGSITKHNFGLYYGEELVAVMTFTKPRFDNDRCWELVRFCSSKYLNIVGGGSKLLKAFRARYPGSIVSYSDKRWSTGGLYKNLGFILSHSSAPGYKYYKYKSILSRYKCQKHLLPKLIPEYYKEELSESEIMKLAGYNKVYDCGNDVWILET